MCKRMLVSSRWAWFCLATLAATTGCFQQKTPPGYVTVVIESSPTSLDPRIGTDAQSERIDPLIFDSLLVKDDHFQLHPSLALSWEQPDPTTYLFHLRSGVHFHDGRALTSRDVVYTLTSMRDGTVITGKAGAFKSVQSVEAPDPATVVLHLKQSDPALLWNLSDGAFGVVPFGSKRDFGQHPVGSGAFKFVRQEQDNEVVLERFDNGWEPAPHIPGVRFAVVPDATTQALEIQKGSADIAVNSLRADAVATLQKNPNLTVTDTPGTILAYLGFNLRDPILKDARVRSAIAFSIDRQAIIHALLRGHARLAESILPPDHWAWAAHVTAHPYDPTAAKLFLDEAGYKPDAHGIRLHLTMKTSTDEGTRMLAAVLQQQLRASGIALDLRSFEFATFYSDVVRGAFQMYSLRWIGGNEDPDIFRYAFQSAMTPPNGANRGHYANPEIDRIIADAATHADPKDRLADYIQIQQILSNDQPAINLWYFDNVIVSNRRVQGLTSSPSGNYDFLRSITLAPSH